MKVPRVLVRVFEPDPAIAEINPARDSRVDHPLQRAVDGGAADSSVLTPDQIDERVGAQMALLAKKDADNQVALRRPAAAGRTMLLNELGRGLHGQPSACEGWLNVERRTAAAGRLRVRVLDGEPAAHV